MFDSVLGWSHFSGNSWPVVTTCTGSGLSDFISTNWGWKGYRSSGLTSPSRRRTDSTTSSRDLIRSGESTEVVGLYTDIRQWMVMLSVWRQSVIILGWCSVNNNNNNIQVVCRYSLLFLVSKSSIHSLWPAFFWLSFWSNISGLNSLYVFSPVQSSPPVSDEIFPIIFIIIC